MTNAEYQEISKAERDAEAARIKQAMHTQIDSVKYYEDASAYLFRAASNAKANGLHERYRNYMNARAIIRRAYLDTVAYNNFLRGRKEEKV